MNMESVKESLDLMINKEIGSVAFYKLQEDDIRITFTRMYLDGKGIVYRVNETKHKKYGKGIEIYIENDKEYLDATEEYLGLASSLGGITQAEDRLLKEIYNKKWQKPYFHFATKEEMNLIRFDIIYYLTNAELEVRYDKGLIIIY